MAVNAFLVCVGAVCLGAVARAAGLPPEPSSSGPVIQKCERAASSGIFFFKRVFEPCVYLCSGIPISFENEDDGTPCQVLTSPPGVCSGGKCVAPPEAPTTEAVIPTTAVPSTEPAPEQSLEASELNNPGAETEVPTSSSADTPKTGLEEGENEGVAKDSENDVANGSGEALNPQEDIDVVDEDGKAPVAEESQVADDDQAEELQNDAATGSADAPIADEISAVTAEESEAPGAEDSQAAEEELAKPAIAEEEEGSGSDDSAAPAQENAVEQEDVATL